MQTLELEIPLSGAEQEEILVAELSEAGFDGFLTEAHRLKAYAPADPDLRSRAEALLAGLRVEGVRCALIDDRDWNEEWERSFAPVEIEGRIRIRAPYHDPAPEGMTEVILTPRRAFGSGHHATTCLMASALAEERPAGREVLDVGCGTGVLAILALKLGAAHADAVDNDEWAVRNTRDHASANGVEERIDVLLGDVGTVAGRTYDLLLANIHRNVLTAQMTAYAEALRPGGVLWMSGFPDAEAPLMEETARRCGLTPSGIRCRDGWAAVRAVKEAP